jgi:hypothetical protein
MFWGERIALDQALATIRAWIRPPPPDSIFGELVAK